MCLDYYISNKHINVVLLQQSKVMTMASLLLFVCTALEMSNDWGFFSLYLEQPKYNERMLSPPFFFFFFRYTCSAAVYANI